MPYIPVEQLKDILLKLSHKDLVRFSFVSEEWKDTITNPKFATAHLQRSMETNSDPAIFLIPSAANAAIYLTLKFSDNDTRGQLLKINQTKKPVPSVNNIVGCCHGLVCYITYDRGRYRLWNPSIRRFKKISSGPLGNTNTYDGFGYDSVNDDCKIVRIAQSMYLADDDSKVYAYSRKSGLWKRIFTNLPHNNYSFKIQPNAVCFDGALHWIVTHKENRSRIRILSFDLASEKFRELPMPLFSHNIFNAIFDYKSRSFNVSLVVVGGYLCIYPKKALNRAWIVKEYGATESWTELYSFSDANGSNCKPVMFSKCGKKVLLEENYRRIAWYDLEKNTRTLVTTDAMPSAFSTVISMGNIHLLRS